MTIWEILLHYSIVAGATSLSSYFLIFIPALNLLEEITEEPAEARGLVGAVSWIISAFIAAPLVLLKLLRGNNNRFITDVTLQYLKEEEDEDNE